MDPLTLADLIEGADLSSLTDHGDTVPLVPGYDVRLVVEYDEDCSIDDEDPEVIGRLQWERSDQRPNGFDGAARILERHWRDGRLWWQPPTDLVKGRDGAAADRIETMAHWIRDRLESGWLWVALELIGPAPDLEDDWRYRDYHAHRPTIMVAGVGGVDSVEDGYLAHLIQEQQSELEHYVRQIPNSQHPTI